MGMGRADRYKTRGEYDPCTLGCGIPAADGLVSAHPLHASIHALPRDIEKLRLIVLVPAKKEEKIWPGA